MKKFILLLFILLSAVFPAAAEFDDMEDMDYWYDQLWILSEEIGCRPVGSEGEVAAMNHIHSVFEELGFSAEDGTLNEYAVETALGTDLEAIIPASQNEAPSIIIVGAHYDCAPPKDIGGGEIRDVNGTRDNASGVAAMLAFAREFAVLSPFPDTELRFVAFTAEETGHQGSFAYVDTLTQEELDRTIGMFNIDLITVDVWLDNHVFSCDTMGMRTENGYIDGTDESPAVNKVARAIQAAIEELGYFDPAENGETHCVPRNYGMSDHDAFHFTGVDSANLAFRGNVEEGGNWHPYMHLPDDNLGDLDLSRTYEALHIIYTAIHQLAQDASYGD